MNGYAVFLYIIHPFLHFVNLLQIKAITNFALFLRAFVGILHKSEYYAVLIHIFNYIITKNKEIFHNNLLVFYIN